MNDKCVWTYIPSCSEFSEDYWETSCGKAFVMIDGTPNENGYNFCPSCGKELNEFYMPVDEEPTE